MDGKSLKLSFLVLVLGLSEVLANAEEQQQPEERAAIGQAKDLMNLLSKNCKFNLNIMLHILMHVGQLTNLKPLIDPQQLLISNLNQNAITVERRNPDTYKTGFQKVLSVRNLDAQISEVDCFSFKILIF